MNLKENIKKRRLCLGLTLEDVAQHVGISRQTAQKYESGVVINIPSNRLAKLAEVLKTTPSELMGWDNRELSDENISSNILKISTKKIPLISKMTDGIPIFTNEEKDGYIELGSKLSADFCLKFKGDSMINANINDGDIVFVQKQKNISNGQIAAVLLDDDITLKRVFINEDSVVLSAENPKYPPLIYTSSNFEEVVILGKALSCQFEIK